MADHLRAQPTDLTALPDAEKEGFESWLREVIDGRNEVGAHGAREMPVWGMTFSLQAGDEGEVEAMLDDLVRFVIQLQRPAGGD